ACRASFCRPKALSSGTELCQSARRPGVRREAPASPRSNMGRGRLEEHPRIGTGLDDEDGASRGSISEERTMRARLVSLATGALGAACLLGAAAALAQGEVSVQHFQPAIGPENFLSVDGARISDQTPFSLGVMVNYSSSPFRLPCEAPLCSDEERL